MRSVLISNHAMEKIEELPGADQSKVLRAIEDFESQRFPKLRALLRGDSVTDGDSFIYSVGRDLRVVYRIDDERQVILIVTVIKKGLD